MELNGWTWFILAWICCWPVISVVLIVLLLRDRIPFSLSLIRRKRDDDE